MPKRIAVLIADIFEDMEAMYPIFRLREAGFEVVTIGLEAGKTYTSKHQYPLTSDAGPKAAKAADFDGVYIPGGYAPDKFRRDKDLVQFVADMDKAGKMIGSICHGPWMLCEADVLRGKNFTSVGAIRRDCENAGGTYHDQAVVQDGHLFTSRTPPDLPAQMRAILKWFGVDSPQVN
ncbi:MAG: type 1 glutamine amidotransferase domain-containing protein [Sumerlaeia bacterium]